MSQNYYIARNKDKQILKKSSSGGVFCAVSDAWMSAHGNRAVVYGCVMRMGENIGAVHTAAYTKEDRNAFLGSKYIGSDASFAMRSALSDIAEGRYVLFSGTPCQIAGLYSCLRARGIEYSDKLLTLEFICHGVGSTRYLCDYIKSYEKRYASKAAACSFRGKSRPSKRQEMVIEFENKKKYVSPSAKYDEFLGAYTKNLIIRPSCFRCRFAKEERNANICVGDYWSDTLADGGAYSSVITDGGIGDDWLKKSVCMLDIEQVGRECISQPQLRGPSELPEDYGEFWDEYEAHGYDAAQRKLTNTCAKTKVKKLLATIAYRLYITEAAKKLKKTVRRR